MYNPNGLGFTCQYLQNMLRISMFKLRSHEAPPFWIQKKQSVFSFPHGSPIWQVLTVSALCWPQRSVFAVKSLFFA